MRYCAIPLLVVTVLLLWACSDVAKGPFEEAARLDQQQQQVKAVELYLKAHESAPESRFGKLSLARAEVLLLELGAQQYTAKQWDALDATGGQLLTIEGAVPAGNLYKSVAAFGKARYELAEGYLKKASGELRGVTPPSEAAIEATAEALFSGATAGADSALKGSVVDASYLSSMRERLGKRIEREREAASRRAELLKQGTVEAMENLLINYSKSDEAAKVRGSFAKALGAKLKTPEKVGPPTVDDPDPIATLVDRLNALAPEEEATKKALGRVERLRPAWEKRYEEQITAVDEQVGKLQETAMGRIAVVIRDKCAPARRRLEDGDASAEEPLKAAAEEAAALIPHGMVAEELQKIQLFILANCTPQKKQR